MRSETPQLHWLPYLVIVIGLTLATILWYTLSNYLNAYLAVITALDDYIPWVALVSVAGVFLLIGALIRVTQLARDRARTLISMNEDLKKEINERIKAEDTKLKLELALSQGQKLQAMGTLAGGIAHDFNNLLYAIIGYVTMAREDAKDQPLIYQNLGKVLEAAHRGQDLIARILAFSRRQHHQFDAINLKQTIEAALSLLRPTIPASVIMHFHAENNPAIMGNQTQIHQVLVNLINNAVDAMDGEGTISISMREIAANDLLLQRLPDKKPVNYCQIDITDTGHGMDQHTIERSFEPFFTTKEVGKGTGLGLSIVHSIIKEHDGEITVSSQLGHGTTFSILLPECVSPS